MLVFPVNSSYTRLWSSSLVEYIQICGPVLRTFSKFVIMPPTATNGLADLKPVSKGADNTARFDPNFTQNVINAMGPKTSPRMRKVMSSLIQHVHDFARENELTVDEWMQGVQLLNWAGKMSDDKRNEGQLVCDVIGLES